MTFAGRLEKAEIFVVRGTKTWLLPQPTSNLTVRDHGRWVLLGMQECAICPRLHCPTTSHQNGAGRIMERALKSGGRQLASLADVFELDRDDDTRLQLDDDSTSRRHAAFRIQQDRLIRVAQ